MLVQSEQRLDDARVREIVRRHPWATLVTHGEDGLLASHMPALVDDAAPDELVLLTHTARADPQTARIEARAELLVVVQGEHGFMAPGWHGPPGTAIGTWNFEAVHVHGRPEPLDRAGSLDLLRRTFEHLQRPLADPVPWSAVDGIAERIVGGTCCFRLPATRIDAKAKLGQDKPADLRARLIAGLERPGPYHQPGLAARMRETLR
jgi:transcriptional regulator